MVNTVIYITSKLYVGSYSEFESEKCKTTKCLLYETEMEKDGDSYSSFIDVETGRRFDHGYPKIIASHRTLIGCFDEIKKFTDYIGNIIPLKISKEEALWLFRKRIENQ